MSLQESVGDMDDSAGGVKGKRASQARNWTGEIDDIKNLPSSQPVSLVAIASRNAGPRRKKKLWRPLTAEDLDNDSQVEFGAGADHPNSGKPDELVTSPSPLPPVLDHPQPSPQTQGERLQKSGSSGKIEATLSQSQLLALKSPEDFESPLSRNMNLASRVYVPLQSETRTTTLPEHYEEIFRSVDPATGEVFDCGGQTFGTLGGRGLHQMGYRSSVPLAMRPYQSIPEPYYHAGHQDYSLERAFQHHGGPWQSSPRTYNIPLDDRIGFRRAPPPTVPPQGQHFLYLGPQSRQSRDGLQENRQISTVIHGSPEDPSIRMMPRGSLLPKTARPLPTGELQVQRVPAYSSNHEVKPDPTLNLKHLHFGSIPLERDFKTSAELASLVHKRRHRPIKRQTKPKPLSLIRDTDQIDPGENFLAQSALPSAVPSVASSATQFDPSKVISSLLSPTSLGWTEPCNELDEVEYANNTVEASKVSLARRNNRGWGTPSWLNTRAPNPFAGQIHATSSTTNTFPSTVPIWKPEDYMSFEHIFGKRSGIYAMNLPADRDLRESPIIGDTRGLLERPVLSPDPLGSSSNMTFSELGPPSGHKMPILPQFSENDPPPALIPPPGLPIPPGLGLSNNLHGSKAIVSLEARNAAYNRRRASASEEWFTNNDVRTKEPFRQHRESDAVEVASRRRKAGEKAAVVEKNGRVLDADTLLLGDVLASMRSYVLECPKDHRDYFADFESVRGGCIEPSHGGRRSYFDTDPNGNKWKAPGGIFGVNASQSPSSLSNKLGGPASRG